MDADQFAYASGGGGAGIGGGFDGADIASHDGGHEASVDFLPADEHDVRRLAHRVGGFNHPDEPASLDHAERVADVNFDFVRHVRTLASQHRRTYAPKHR